MANTSTNPLAGENSRQGRERDKFLRDEKEHQQATKNSGAIKKCYD